MAPISIVLIVVSVFMVAFVVYGVRRSRMRIEDTLFWVFLSLLILALSIFPQIAIWFSEALGFQAPINFIFLFFIFVLIVKCYSLSRDVSSLENKVKELAQQIAVDKLKHDEDSPDEQNREDG